MTSDAEIIPELKRVILDGLTRRAPYKGPNGSGLIFTGSFDWHSSVHAHWALLSMARVTEDAELRELIHARLSEENLVAERTFLQDAENAAFELPYGRAWLCLLLAELSKQHEGADEVVTAMRREAGRTVVAWLEENASSHELTRCGSHRSWLFSFWLLQMSRPGRSIQTRLDTLRERIHSMWPAIRALEAAPPLGYDFLHLPAILQMIDDATPHEDDTPRLFLGESFGEVDEFNCHQCGANAARLWPFARSGSSHFRAGLSDLMQRREQWDGDFRLVSHWVPQFVWLGLMLERGELS